MCGIVAYVGAKPAYPIVIDGLKRLEYRGYDSAGVATIEPLKYGSFFVQFRDNVPSLWNLLVGFCKAPTVP